MSTHKRIRAGVESETYWMKFRFAGKQYYRDSGARTKEDADKIEAKLLRALQENRIPDLLERTSQRPAAKLTVGEILTAYEAGAREITLGTRTTNTNCLRLILRKALELDTNEAADAIPVDQLTDDLVYAYKQTVLDSAADEDDVRAQQMQRSANSMLRQARSVFTPAMLSFYKREKHLAIPQTIHGFLTEPGFRHVGKLDYNKPSDAIIAKTFTALETLAGTDRNMYVAIWLSLGFGLRKSEISNSKISWFFTRDGILFLRGDALAKNHQIADIRVQLGASAKLAQYLKNADPNAYLIEGHNTERRELVFRRISAWLRSLGWATQKTIHEFRAYAGCKVAESEGLLAAQRWLRHASYQTTERNYGRYINIHAKEVALVIPSTPNTQFVPQVINGGQV